MFNSILIQSHVFSKRSLTDMLSIPEFIIPRYKKKIIMKCIIFVEYFAKVSTILLFEIKNLYGCSNKK